jgi:hypothetical protein
MYPLRAALLAFGGVSFGLALVFLWPPNTSPVGVVFFVASPVSIGIGEAYASRRRGSEWLTDTYGTFENFRASIDTGPLRELKHERGELRALLRLRRQYPNLATELARQVVDEL